MSNSMALGELLTAWTVRISLLSFAASLLAQLVRPGSFRLARFLWSFGLLWLLVHVACAFHFHHQWSHQAALSHTAQQTAEQLGWAFAGGLYFNYVFVGLWGWDALWWWFRAESYAQRSPLLSAGIHGFLLFIIFQATVVFEQGLTRWTSVAIFLSLTLVKAIMAPAAR